MKKTVYVVSNSHIDPVWLWSKYEGIDEVINTFRAACERLDENPDMYFSASSIIFYKWVEEIAPDVFERIKKHVFSGRWEIVGDWLVEADTVMPLADSFIKSTEISRKYTKEKFCKTSVVAYSPDTFGHPATLPKTLVDTGYKYYIFCRPCENEHYKLPSNTFWWEYNEKKILCHRLKFHYQLNWNMTADDVEQKLNDENFYNDGIGCLFIGCGDHGGGPTKKEIASIKEVQARRPDLDIKFSTCLEFFKAAEKINNIPVIKGDIHNDSVGCYSVNRNIKKAIKNAERSLLYAQRILDNNKNIQIDLNDMWETVIFNQFHDILPGSCDPNSAKQALNELARVQDNLDNIAYRETKKISRTVPVNCKQGEFRIYNSLPYSVKSPFEIESFMYYRSGCAFKKSDGTEISIQEITPSVACTNRRWLFFDEIPAKSMSTYYFDSEDDAQIAQDTKIFYEYGDIISNGNVTISRLNINKSGKDFFDCPLEFEVLNDLSDVWSHGINCYDYGSEGFFEEKETTVKKGDLASYFISRLEFGKSEIEAQFIAYKDMPFVDLKINVIWNEKCKILKLNILPNSKFQNILVQGPSASIEKNTINREEPLHGWLICGDLGICQKGAFAYHKNEDGKICVTLVRSSIFGWDMGWKRDLKGHENHTDLGEHNFTFRFFMEENLNEKTMNENLALLTEPFNVMRENKTF